MKKLFLTVLAAASAMAMATVSSAQVYDAMQTEIQAAQAQNAKAQAEYQEYLRKKKAEEDFWNAK